MTTPRIPKDWTPEQASAVLDFLYALANAIWDQYEQAIAFLQVLEHSHHDDFPLPDDDQPFDDEIPF